MRYELGELNKKFPSLCNLSGNFMFCHIQEYMILKMRTIYENAKALTLAEFVGFPLDYFNANIFSNCHKPPLRIRKLFYGPYKIRYLTIMPC